MPSDARPHYLTLPDGQIRLWRTGQGPDLVLLPGLALSAEAGVNRVAALAPGWRVTAIELPGIGGSAGCLPESLASVAATLNRAVTALGLSEFVLVACDLACPLAADLSSRATGTILVAAGTAKDWAARGFAPPPPAAVTDGTHLVALWSHLRDAHIFEPADATQASSTGDALPTPGELDSTLVAAATCPERFATLWRICRDATGGAPSGPAVIRIETLAALPPALDGLRVEAVQASALPATAPGPEGTIWHQYVETSRGLVHLRRSGSDCRPLLILPTGGGSSAQFAPVIKGLAKGRQVFAMDYLGNGLSGKPTGAVDVGSLAEDAAALIAALGFAEFDVWGSHTGALVGLELAVRHPDLVGRCVLEGPVFISPDFQSDLLARYFPRFVPDGWGGHLLQIWNWRRDMFLFWPWYRVERAAARRLGLPSPDDLHLYAIGILESGESYDQAYRSAFSYNTAARLPLLKRPTLICAGPNDMLIEGLKHSEALAVPGVTVRTTPTTVWWPAPDPVLAAETMAVYDSFLRND